MAFHATFRHYYNSANGGTVDVKIISRSEFVNYVDAGKL